MVISNGVARSKMQRNLFDVCHLHFALNITIIVTWLQHCYIVARPLLNVVTPTLDVGVCRTFV